MDRLSPNDLADYLVDIGGTLVSYGCTAYRLEDVIRTVARLEGYEADAFALPTGLFLSLRGPGCEQPILRMFRAKRWGTDLDRLAAIDTIFNDVAERRAPITEARTRLRALEGRPPPYPRWLQWIAGAAVSGAAAVFFRGGVHEVIASTLVGAVVVVVSTLLSRDLRARLLIDFLGSLAAAVVAGGASRVSPDLSREVIVLAGAITLVPGMTLTTGLAEVAQKSLVAGSARLMEAFVTFLSILFGIALAVGLERVFGTDAAAPLAAVAPRTGLPLPYQVVALVVSALSFAVLFAVPRSYVWAAVLSGAIGYIATALGARYLPAHVAAFGAALLVCIFANALARWTERPAQIFNVPGMMLLVPGSFGFLSFEDFLRGEFLGGAAKAFDMILIAGALVTGILFANVLVPPKKIL